MLGSGQRAQILLWPRSGVLDARGDVARRGRRVADHVDQAVAGDGPELARMWVSRTSAAVSGMPEREAAARPTNQPRYSPRWTNGTAGGHFGPAAAGRWLDGATIGVSLRALGDTQIAACARRRRRRVVVQVDVVSIAKDPRVIERLRERLVVVEAICDVVAEVRPPGQRLVQRASRQRRGLGQPAPARLGGWRAPARAPGGPRSACDPRSARAPVIGRSEGRGRSPRCPPSCLGPGALGYACPLVARREPVVGGQLGPRLAGLGRSFLGS